MTTRGTPVLYMPAFILLMLIPLISRVDIFPHRGPDICCISPGNFIARRTPDAVCVNPLLLMLFSSSCIFIFSCQASPGV
jgi:hypothetical protein